METGGNEGEELTARVKSDGWSAQARLSGTCEDEEKAGERNTEEGEEGEEGREGKESASEGETGEEDIGGFAGVANVLTRLQPWEKQVRGGRIGSREGRFNR